MKSDEDDTVPESSKKCRTDVRRTSDIITDALAIIDASQKFAYRTVNIALIQRNWLLGKRIAEEELLGGKKENYGLEVIQNLSRELTKRYGKGYSERNLYNFVQFHRMFPGILQSLIAESPVLSWTHYSRLMTVCDSDARDWYEREAIRESWSVRTLSRNIGTQYYYRMLKSPDPALVEAEMKEKAMKHGQDRLEFIKNPVVAEFLGLSSDTNLYESSLEEAIIDNLQKFLLEMGRGYAFVARQKCIHTRTRNYFIDLVFYNFELDCFVLVDLKTGTLTHQDVGQMDMYVRMYDEIALPKGKNPTLGIILCSETEESVVHYSVLNDKDQLFTAKYLLCLPKEEDLRAEIEAQKTIYYAEHQSNDSEANGSKKVDEREIHSNRSIGVRHLDGTLSYETLRQVSESNIKFELHRPWTPIESNRRRRPRQLINRDRESFGDDHLPENEVGATK